MFPGFIDSRSHVLLKSLTNIMTDLSNDQTNDQLLSKLSLNKETIFYNYEPLFMINPLNLNLQILNNISLTIPILIIHKSGNVAYFNSKLLSMIKQTDLDSNFNIEEGKAYEIKAIMILLSIMLKHLKINYSIIKPLMKNTLMEYAKSGYTTVTDLSLGIPIPNNNYENIKLFKELSKNSPVRLQGYVIYPYIKNKIINNDNFKTLGVKLWNDGSLQTFTGSF